MTSMYKVKEINQTKQHNSTVQGLWWCKGPLWHKEKTPKLTSLAETH